ncbi:MAG: 3-phosphoshikimate 1-carboxyvinyltransferase [Bacteroidales bacterium]|nr:3-phosphoshikimate 1-carboxyvinyltransferase [Bacteroidales bacterium]
MKLHCDINLPASKSESNRALMIAAYGGFAPDFQNLSDSNDTLCLAHALHEIRLGNTLIDIADCGTAARFLTTYLACHEGDWLLTGTERMKQRPMVPIVEALRGLGADIQYVEKEGSMPLRIVGKPILGGKVTVDMSQSSQFASSLLLAAPMWPQGLEMELIGELSSLPYLEMTLTMMRHFGAKIEQNDRMIKVFPKHYHSMDFEIEADWSAASYWYEMAALSEECKIRLHGLVGPSTLRQAQGSGTSSLQGDVVIVDWMRQLGVGTFVEDMVVVLRKIPFEKRPLCFDFSAHPDLYPTMAATCAGLGLEARFLGLDNLHLKESDRVEAMQTELAKLSQHPVHFCAHNDHRIVMALAPLSMLVGPVHFDHPEVVEKSYPRFWEDASFCQLMR